MCCLTLVYVGLAILGLRLLYKLLGKLIWIKDWRNKVVFITGCDSGFGQRFAELVSKTGVTVVAGCLTEKGEEHLEKQRSAGLPNSLYPIHIDITNDDSIQKAREKVDEILKKNGKTLWAVLNNAGIQKENGPEDWLTLDHYKEHMNVNVYGHIRVVHAFKDLLKESKGRFVFTTSILGRIVMPDNGPYNITKFAMEAYVDTLRRHMYDFGVGVSAIEPGGFQTQIITFTPHYFAKLWSAVPHDVKQEYGEAFYQTQHRAWETLRETAQVSNLDPVVSAFSQACFSLFPRPRYVIGWDCWTKYLPASYLPEFLQDIYIRYKFPRTKIAAHI